TSNVSECIPENPHSTKPETSNVSECIPENPHSTKSETSDVSESIPENTSSIPPLTYITISNATNEHSN
ncbi:10710_t:CDS:1, partial [Racocetra fulgida]